MSRPSLRRIGRPSGVSRAQIERDAEFRVDRRGDVFGEVFVVRRPTAFFIGAAQDRAAGDAGAGHDGEAGRGPVIAADRRVDLRRSAEVGHPHHQRRRQQAALLQVDQQFRQALIDRRNQAFLEGVEIIGVRVPAAVGNRHEAHADSMRRRASKQLWPKRVRP